MRAHHLLAFGPFVLDTVSRRLTRNGAEVALGERQLHLLSTLASRAGETVSKAQLMDAAWAGVAVTDNSLDKAISQLRRELAPLLGTPCIETQPRRGYRTELATTCR